MGSLSKLPLTKNTESFGGKITEETKHIFLKIGLPFKADLFGKMCHLENV